MAALSIETERRLAETLYLISEGEKEIESNRILLSENRDFHPVTAFRAIDRLNVRFISFLDLRDFVDKNRIPCSNQEITALIKQYDSDNDGRLELGEFQQLVLPSTNGLLRDLVENRIPLSRLTIDAERLLSRLLENELAFQRRLDNLKRDLTSRYDYSMISGFSLIDYPSTNYLSRDKLYAFFKRNGQSVYEDDIDALLRRMDIDGDERLSYSEFSDFLRVQGISSSPKRSPSPGRASSPLRRSGNSPNRTASLHFQPESSLRASFKNSSPLTVSEESELVSIFFQQINLERDLNSSKKDVALCSDFNLVDAFQMFDVNDLGSVSEYDFETTLIELGLRPNREELVLIFKHYSVLNNRRLSYSEFSNLFVPTEHEYSRIMSSRAAANVPRHSRRRVFSADTTYKLTRVLRLHLESEAAAEGLRVRLARRPSFSLRDAFEAVDKDMNGYITFNEFQNLLEQHGIFATIKDVESLMDRYDKDKDGRVSYSEFLDEVTPKSPKKY